MIKRLLVNTSSNLLQLIVNMVVTFIMAPIYLEMMGHHDYGLREMVVALVGYMGMLDLGMRPTISRFASLHNANRDRDSLLTVYATSLVFMITVGIGLALFFYGWSQTYPELLVSDEALSNDFKYELFLLLVGTQLLFTFPQYVAESYLEGLQRYYLKNIINIISTISIGVVSYIYITPENGLILLTTLVAISAAARMLLFGGMLLRPALGVIYPNLRKFSLAKLREMLIFGFKSFLQGAAYKIDTGLDRIVIGGILGPASVPVYSISFTLVQYINTLTMTLSHSFMPLFTDLSTKNRQDEIVNIYLFASRLMVGMVVVPMGVGVAFIGAPFIDIWMRGAFDFALVNTLILLLVVHVMVPKLNPFSSRFLTAINKHGIFAKVAPVAAVMNLALSVWLVFEIGVVGAALGSVFPVFVVAPIILRHSSYHLKIGALYYLRACVMPALLPVGLMALTLLWFRMSWGMETYAQILASIGIGATVYVSAFYTLSLSASDKRWFADFILRRFRKA